MASRSKPAGKRKAIVANPGTHPEMKYVALGLMEAGWDVTYWTATMWSRDHPLFRAVDPFLPKRVRRQLARRTLPVRLSRRYVHHSGVGYELLHQIARRRGSRLAHPFMRRRNARFARHVAAALRLDREVSAVVAPQTCAIEIFGAAPDDCLRVLSYPIAHHNWTSKYLADEALANPEWARFLQGHDLEPSEAAILDREVDSADFILVGSDFVAETFRAQGIDRDKVLVEPLGTTVSTAPDSPCQEAVVRPLHLLFVGQVNQRKGIGYLVEALSGFSTDEIEFRCIGPVTAEMRARLAEYGVQAEGARDHSYLREAYEWADLLVLPSLVEGFALVVVEAMGAGVPVLVSTHTTDSRLVTQGVNGFVVPPADSRAITLSLVEAIGSRPHLASMGEQARLRVCSLTWAHYESRIAARIGRL